MLSRHALTVSALFPTFTVSRRWVIAGGCLSAALLLSACGKGNAPAVPPGGGMPPPEVGVVTVQPGELGLVTDLPGRLEASRVAQVRARAAGILQQRLFTEGSDVKVGQTLFRIDAAPYEAAVQSAEATLARGQASLVQSTALAERYKPLAVAQAVSQQEYANAIAAQKLAEADVAAGRAAVTTARINLGHARVTAPIAGRIGRALVTEGALVGQGEATQLAVIQQINPMYVNFTQSAAEVMKLRRAMEAGQFKRAGGGQAASGQAASGQAASGQAANVRVLLEDGSEYPLPGKLLFSDLTVDATTGQITLRAQVPNPDGQLLPGLYVRVRLEQAQANNAILLPQQAVTRSAQGDTVLVIGADGKAAPRPIQIGGQQGGQWVVLGGLKAGEQVVVDGFQKLRGNPVVKPVPWAAGGKAAAPATAPASAPAPAASAASAA